jgi:hypothetical protein
MSLLSEFDAHFGGSFKKKTRQAARNDEIIQIEAQLSGLRRHGNCVLLAQ